MLQQKGIKKKTLHKKEFLGAHPIIQFFMDKLRIREIVSSCIVQDERLAIPIEKTLSVLIHNILTSPSPMYELSDWSSPLSENVLELNENEMVRINDHRMGNALDSFYNGKHNEVFFRLSLRAIKIFDLCCQNIHQDTTTVTLSGKYEDWDAKEILTYGHNKDHRPDLKQLVLGMSVTSDGSVPIVHKVYDGNQTDDTLHVKNYERLVKLLKNSDFVYTADSKLATESNLRKIDKYEGKFITVMPSTWREDFEFKSLVRERSIQWRFLLSRKDNRKPNSIIDRYQIASGDHKSSQGYKILWIKSSQKKEQDEETRVRNIKKCLKELWELMLKINKHKLKSRKNVKMAITAILKKRNCVGLIDFEIKSSREYKRSYGKKGRPGPEEKAKVTWKEIFSITFEENHDQVIEAKLTDGIFPLITNIEEGYSSKKILETYKYQPFLEKRHSQLKTWQVLTPILFKKGIRVVAYIHMSVMALMVSSLIERTIRKAMLKEKIEHLPIYPDGKRCEYPTLYGIVRLFRHVERYEVESKNETMYFPAELNKVQKKVLKLLEIPSSLYQ